MDGDVLVAHAVSRVLESTGALAIVLDAEAESAHRFDDSRLDNVTFIQERRAGHGELNRGAAVDLDDLVATGLVGRGSSVEPQGAVFLRGLLVVGGGGGATGADGNQQDEHAKSDCLLGVLHIR